MFEARALVKGKMQNILMHDYAPDDYPRGTIDNQPVHFVKAYAYADGSLAAYMCNGVCTGCPIVGKEHSSLARCKGCRVYYGNPIGTTKTHVVWAAVFDNESDYNNISEGVDLA